MMRMVFAAMVAPLLMACASQPTENMAAPDATQATHPESGLEIIPLTIKHGDATHNFAVEVARTAQEQATGLMFRRQLGANEGMLFPSEVAEVRGFWMKNTVIPLDLIFVGPDNRILNIAANAEPYSLKTLVSDGPAIAVLEIPGGRAAELGVEPGALVEW